MDKNKRKFISKRLLAVAFAVAAVDLYPLSSEAASSNLQTVSGQSYIQLNPVLQSFGYFGTSYYPTGAGYYGNYGGYVGVSSYYPTGYPQYYSPYYSPYSYPRNFYTPYPRRSPAQPGAYQPTTTMVPTELTRHPPRINNPWFTSPGYRSSQGRSGR